MKKIKARIDRLNKEEDKREIMELSKKKVHKGMKNSKEIKMKEKNLKNRLKRQEEVVEELNKTKMHSPLHMILVKLAKKRGYHRTIRSSSI